MGSSEGFSIVLKIMWDNVGVEEAVSGRFQAGGEREERFQAGGCTNNARQSIRGAPDLMVEDA